MTETSIIERAGTFQDTGAEAARRRVNKLLFGIDSPRRLGPPVKDRDMTDGELDEMLRALWRRLGVVLAREGS